VNDVRVAMDAIRGIVRILREGSRAAEKQVGLSSAQLFVLHRLGDGPMTISELAAATATHQSSVSVVVKRLVGAGLVTRGVSAIDRRRREVTVTASGRRLLRRAPGAAQDRLLDALAGLPAAQRRRLAAGLAALARAMGAGSAPAAMFFEERSMVSQVNAARGRQARPLPRPRAPRARRDRPGP
jgi:DNA-binding MarR family transcriptional regulator